MPPNQTIELNQTRASDQTIQVTTPSELRSWISDGSAVMIDVRESGEFLGENIKGSISHPLSRLNAEHLSKHRADRIVLICASGARARKAGKTLTKAGLDRVWYIEGGLDALKRAAFDVHKSKNAPISIMRQVQMIAGGLSLTGVILGYTIHPGFYAISAIVGSGLLFAGASGTCMMASVLAHLPYNRYSNEYR